MDLIGRYICVYPSVLYRMYMRIEKDLCNGLYLATPIMTFENSGYYLKYEQKGFYRTISYNDLADNKIKIFESEIYYLTEVGECIIDSLKEDAYKKAMETNKTLDSNIILTSVWDSLQIEVN